MRSSGRESSALRARFTTSAIAMNAQMRRERGTIGGLSRRSSGLPSTRQGWGLDGSDLRSGVRGWGTGLGLSLVGPRPAPGGAG
jgi:hypothetical protein